MYNRFFPVLRFCVVSSCPAFIFLSSLFIISFTIVMGFWFHRTFCGNSPVIFVCYDGICSSICIGDIHTGHNCLIWSIVVVVTGGIVQLAAPPALTHLNTDCVVASLKQIRYIINLIWHIGRIFFISRIKETIAYLVTIDKHFISTLCTYIHSCTCYFFVIGRELCSYHWGCAIRRICVNQSTVLAAFYCNFIFRRVYSYTVKTFENAVGCTCCLIKKNNIIIIVTEHINCKPIVISCLACVYSETDGIQVREGIGVVITAKGIQLASCIYIHIVHGSTYLVALVSPQT